MTLAKRLLAGSLAIIAALGFAVVLIAGGRLRNRLDELTATAMEREARVIALQWHSLSDADSIADAAGAALDRRVTLIDSTGVVRGDSKFDSTGLTHLENHSHRPEVIEARATGTGRNLRQSKSAGDQEMYVAVKHPLGFVRVSITTTSLDAIIAGAQRDVVVASLIALLGSALLVLFFSRSVTKPVVELRDVARAIAAGDLERRPSLTAPGEVGDLAIALHRMAEQLEARLEALAADETLLNAVVDSLHEGIVVVDAKRTVLRVNGRGRALLGLGDPVPFPADHLPRDPLVQRALQSAMRGAAVDPAETSLDGRMLLITARPLGGGAVLAVLDVTARRRLEMVRRDFVANVSHELKTPLTVITGFAETLTDPTLPAEQRVRFAEMVQSSAQRMQRIVDDLLDLSRYESGGWTPSPVTMSVRGLVTDTLTAVRNAADAKGLTLNAELPAGDLVLNADPTAARQVLANLTENAVRYTQSGTVTVFAAREGHGVRIGVRDTGIGIAAEHLPRLFERFYRVDSARSRSQGGTGLGLAIVKHLVEAHGGKVRAESVPGRGTTMSAWFPDAPSGAPEPLPD